MPLLTLVIILVLIAVGMWALNTYVPMGAGWKKLINVVVAIVVVIWLLKVFGVFQYLSAVHT